MKKNVEFGGVNCYTLKKCFNVMKVLLFITILSVGQLLAVESYSQKTKLSLDLNQSDLIQILDEIEDQSSFYFLFNEKLVDLDRKVSIKVEDQSIDKVLETIFDDSDIEYQIIDRKIILTPGNAVMAQQTVNVRGTVTNSQNEPLPGVTVVVLGTAKGTITDVDGNYQLDNVSGNAVLAFSFIGMKTQEIAVNGRSLIEVKLEEEAIGLEEVVAIGYGSVKKSDLTGSVASISTEDITSSSTNSVVQTLQGRAAGVQVSTGDASPGGGINIRIRGTSTITGSTEPLYIVDGFPVNSDNDDLYVQGGYNEGSIEGHAATKVRPNALSFINPADIESIEILKDAAATAIYGSRGANGVVLIKTKRGEEGRNQVNINYSLGAQKLIRKIKRLDGPAWAARLTESEINGGLDPGSVR